MFKSIKVIARIYFNSNLNQSDVVFRLSEKVEKKLMKGRRAYIGLPCRVNAGTFKKVMEAMAACNYLTPVMDAKGLCIVNVSLDNTSPLAAAKDLEAVEERVTQFFNDIASNKQHLNTIDKSLCELSERCRTYDESREPSGLIDVYNSLSGCQLNLNPIEVNHGDNFKMTLQLTAETAKDIPYVANVFRALECKRSARSVEVSAKEYNAEVQARHQFESRSNPLTSGDDFLARFLFLAYPHIPSEHKAMFDRYKLDYLGEPPQSKKMTATKKSFVERLVHRVL